MRRLRGGLSAGKQAALIVGGCVCLLLSWVGYGYFGYMDAQAHFDTRSSLEPLARGIDRYAALHGGCLPPMQDMPVLERAVRPYLTTDELMSLDFYDRAWGYGGKTLDTNASLSGRDRRTIGDSSRILAVYRAQGDWKGRHDALFLDGRIRLIGPAEWPAVKEHSRLDR